MHYKPYYVIKKDDDDDEEEDVEIHHHHHYHHGHHPDMMGVYHHDRHASGSYEHGSVMANVHERVENPPHTWAAYHDKPGGLMAIVEMEYRELMEEKAEGSHSGIKKELTDLAAACICALKKM